jgi:hypothetical protein
MPMPIVFQFARVAFLVVVGQVVLGTPRAKWTIWTTRGVQSAVQRK